MNLVAFSCDRWGAKYFAMLQEASDLELQNIGSHRMTREEISAAFACTADRWDRLMVTESGELVGDVNVFFSAEDSSENTAEVNLFVKGAFRNRGWGGFALSRAIDMTKGRGVHCIKAIVNNDNLQAQEFFKRHGFVFCKEIPAFKQQELVCMIKP